MAYRNGTYVAFHAGGTSDPTASDIKYYNMMKAWDENSKIDFSFTNSHDKTSAVRDSSKRVTLERSIKERLNNSKNFVLILTDITKEDTDWVPFEIRYAVDECDLPIIAAYPKKDYVLKPSELSGYWPVAFSSRIDKKSLKAIHIPFKKSPILDAIGQFSLQSNNLNGPLNYYSREAHESLGLL